MQFKITEIFNRSNAERFKDIVNLKFIK